MRVSFESLLAIHTASFRYFDYLKCVMGSGPEEDDVPLGIGGFAVLPSDRQPRWFNMVRSAVRTSLEKQYVYTKLGQYGIILARFRFWMWAFYLFHFSMKKHEVMVELVTEQRYFAEWGPAWCRMGSCLVKINWRRMRSSHIFLLLLLRISFNVA